MAKCKGYRGTITVVVATVVAWCAIANAQLPNHPIITEIYNNPVGANDGPVGHDLQNLHQEFIEIYLPTAGDLDVTLLPFKDAFRLAFYEVEGDLSSSGNTLVNYRFDLPAFDLDPSNGITAVARPPSGVVVLGWVDYVGDPPTGLAGIPAARTALVNGGITSTGGGYLFIAMNGEQFSGDAPPGGGGTTNPDFDTPVAESLIHLPSEATSGIVQNGSSAYLLVNRDAVGYVELYDDKDLAHVIPPDTTNADPSLATGTVLMVTSFLDGLAGNNDSSFEVDLQPYPINTGIDLDDTLPLGGPYSLIIAQIATEDESSMTPSLGGGFARRFVDVPKTSETAAADDPVQDALNAYRLVRNNGPFFATPGQAVFTTTPPELGLATDSSQMVDVISETTASAQLIAANVGGNFNIDMAVTGATGHDTAIATFGAGSSALAVSGQSFGFPTVAITGTAGAVDGASTTATVSVEATNTSAGDPAVVNGMQTVAMTATVLNPTMGIDELGQPDQATVFVALQGVVEDPGVVNEFLQTDLGGFLAAQPDITLLDWNGHGADLINPAIDISDPFVVNPWIRDMPSDGDECITWLNPPGPVGGTDLVTTVQNSAEILSGSQDYLTSIATCIVNGQTFVKARRANIPDALTFGGTFSPSEPVSFVSATGSAGNVAGGLTNVTTSRTFEVAIIDTSVRFNGTLESGATDDFGLVLQVAQVEAGSTIEVGEFIALSFTGGLGLASVDSLAVPPGNHVAVIIYLDLDNLHNVLGIRNVESIFIVDSQVNGNFDVIEAFDLTVGGGGCVPATCDDGVACNGLEQCVADQCVLGTNQCEDNIDCTDNVCDMGLGVCQFPPNDSLCPDDGTFCNGAEVCNPLLGCESSGPPCPDCDEVMGCSCEVPLVEAVGSRYLRITPLPVDAVLPMAFKVTFCSGATRWVGPLADETTAIPFDIAPVPAMPSPDGTLGSLVNTRAEALFLTPSEWGGDVYVTDEDMIPSESPPIPPDIFRDYDVQTDCGAPGGPPSLTLAVTVTMPLFGDSDLNGVTTLIDASAVVKAFQGNYSVFGGTSIPQLDIHSCTPNQVMSLVDASWVVKVFQGESFYVRCPSALPCPAP